MVGLAVGVVRAAKVSVEVGDHPEQPLPTDVGSVVGLVVELMRWVSKELDDAVLKEL